MTVPDDLRAAADRLEKHGWTQGRSETRDAEPLDRKMCVLGALGYVTFGNMYVRDRNLDRVPRRRYNASVNAVCEFIGRSPVNWNDDPTTTQELVVKTLRSCADGLEEDDDRR